MQYIFTKIINAERLQLELWSAGINEVTHIDTVETQVYVCTPDELTSEKVILLNSLVAGHLALTTDEYLLKILRNAKMFGESVIEDFTLQNMKLGITQDGKTNDVRKATSQVRSALTSGSLKDAILEIRGIPEEQKDGKYLTNTRLLQTINKLEAYMGLSLSESL